MVSEAMKVRVQYALDDLTNAQKRFKYIREIASNQGDDRTLDLINAHSAPLATIVDDLKAFIENVSHVYEVIVGNIGVVYRGNDKLKAYDNYSIYLRQSWDNYGRTAGEEVTLMIDGVPHILTFEDNSAKISQEKLNEFLTEIESILKKS